MTREELIARIETDIKSGGASETMKEILREALTMLRQDSAKTIPVPVSTQISAIGAAAEFLQREGIDENAEVILALKAASDSLTARAQTDDPTFPDSSPSVARAMARFWTKYAEVKEAKQNTSHPSPQAQPGIELETTEEERERWRDANCGRVSKPHYDVGPSVKAGRLLALLRDIDRLLAERRQPAGEDDRPFDFVVAMEVAVRALGAWSAKPHNVAKWVRKIEGTPIPNDICVVMAEHFVEAFRTPSRPPPDEAVRRAVAEIKDGLDCMQLAFEAHENGTYDWEYVRGARDALVDAFALLSPAQEENK